MLHLNYCLLSHKILITNIKTLAFSQPKKKRLYMIPSPLFLTKLFLPSLFGQIPKLLKTPLSPFMCSQATRRASILAAQLQKENGY